jgi:hypothetical protein
VPLSIPPAELAPFHPTRCRTDPRPLPVGGVGHQKIFIDPQAAVAKVGDLGGGELYRGIAMNETSQAIFHQRDCRLDKNAERRLCRNRSQAFPVALLAAQMRFADFTRITQNARAPPLRLEFAIYRDTLRAHAEGCKPIARAAPGDNNIIYEMPL